MCLKVLMILLFDVLLLVHGGKLFRLGRSKGGNLGSPGDYAGEKLPPEQWFKQRLDHFSPTDLKTWKQRYYVNDSFYDFNNPGPIFLMIGGEGPADPRWMVKGTWIDYAKIFKALCINLEHRYYGESHPTSDLSTKNLQYLSSSQALADLANFITAMNDKLKLNKKVKWVAFGGSYPGSLAAWLRMKYPHLVYAAVSSSGPLLAKVNFMEYFEVVVNALREKTNGEECVTQLRLAHNQIESMMKVKPKTIEEEFRVCKPFSNATKNDMRNFFSSIADDFADLVQYNEDNRISSDNRFRNITINTVCKMLTEPGHSPAYKRLAAFNSIMLDKANQTCMDYSYSNMIDELRNITWGSEGVVGGGYLVAVPGGGVSLLVHATEGGRVVHFKKLGRPWMYQTCTEFGFYQTSSGEVEAFGNHFTLDFFVQQCRDVFGTKFNDAFIEQAAEWTNSYYGGLDISVSRVVFVHGSVDPWHALGLTTTEDGDAPAIYIHGTAHCANMYPASENDNPELTKARIEIRQYLATWLGQP